MYIPRTNVNSFYDDNKLNYIGIGNYHGCVQVTSTIYSEAKSLYGEGAMDFIKQKLFEYKNDTDQISKDHIDYLYTCLLNAKVTGYKCCPSDFYYEQRAFAQYRKDEKDGILAKFIIPEKFEEVFANYHGFRFARKEIKDYVKDKDILDIGSYIGDSALVLSQYTNKKIYSFDITPHHLEMVRNTSILNHISDKVITTNKGLGSKESIMYVSGTNVNSGNSVSKKGKIPIPITTIDKEVFSRNITPGVIKADIEGSEYDMLLGAKKTIEKFRPIITISVYHNFAGLFQVPDYIKSFDNYKIFFRACHHTYTHMGEMIMFAYPEEIGNFTSFEEDNNTLSNDNILYQ